jgi:hypothetical protein
VETSLKSERLVVLLAIIPNNNVQHSVKQKFDLMNQSSFLNKNFLKYENC